MLNTSTSGLYIVLMQYAVLESDYNVACIFRKYISEARL